MEYGSTKYRISLKICLSDKNDLKYLATYSSNKHENL